MNASVITEIAICVHTNRELLTDFILFKRNKQLGHLRQDIEYINMYRVKLTACTRRKIMSIYTLAERILQYTHMENDVECVNLNERS